MSQKIIYYVAIGTAVLFGIMQIYILYSAIIEIRSNMSTMAVDINTITNTLLEIFFIVLGNIMPKCKLNSTVGVRTTWSMKNDRT